jgi:hypothetical protein
MIIKRWNGATYDELFPKTISTMLYTANGITQMFDGDKIKPAYLPNIVFDSLRFYDVLGSSVNLRAVADLLRNDALTWNRSPIGLYYVANAGITLTANASSTLEAGSYYITELTAGDGTVGGTSTVLESGDWFVLTDFTGAGTVGDPYVCKFAVVNNTYELATTSANGIVRLSDQAVWSSLSGNNVITDARLKALVEGYAAPLVLGTAVTIATNDQILLADASDTNKVKRATITFDTGVTTTYLRRDGTFATPPNTTYSAMSDTVLGLGKVFNNTTQSTAANSVTTTASRTYGIQKNASDQLVVNVPWTEYAAATSTTLGLVRFTDDTALTQTPQALTTDTNRTYRIQKNNDNQLVVNVPWSGATYGVGTRKGLSLTGSDFAMVTPIYIQASDPGAAGAPDTGLVWFDI